MFFFRKLHRKLKHLFLRPIRVFVFHQVSDVYNPDVMWDCDWTSTDSFKQNIGRLQKEYSFISLRKAYKHIRMDLIRIRKYAVLTSDDGWNSLHNILPWLFDQNIPVTLFLNPAYLLREESPEKGPSSLMEETDLDFFIKHYPNLISIASHGWTHAKCSSMPRSLFHSSVKKSTTYLSQKTGYIPFFAYPCGDHNDKQDAFLLDNNIIPVYCDGMKNYNDAHCIHRECIDEGYTK